MITQTRLKWRVSGRTERGEIIRSCRDYFRPIEDRTDASQQLVEAGHSVAFSSCKLQPQILNNRVGSERCIVLAKLQEKPRNSCWIFATFV